MNTLPTVEEFMTDEYQIKNYGTILLKPKQAAIEFAKLHVKAAKKTILDNASLYLNPDNNEFEIDLNSIRNVYPENLIK